MVLRRIRSLDLLTFLSMGEAICPTGGESIVVKGRQYTVSQVYVQKAGEGDEGGKYEGHRDEQLFDWLDSVCCRGIHSTYDTFDPQFEPISMLPEQRKSCFADG